jgi:hypothetical protein
VFETPREAIAEAKLFAIAIPLEKVPWLDCVVESAVLNSGDSVFFTVLFLLHPHPIM